MMKFRNPWCLLLFCLLFCKQGKCQQTIYLNGAWEFHKVGDNNWLKATVPGTVHTDLLSNKLINDPFYRTNEKSLQWVDREDWEYRTTFAITGDLLKNNKLYLAFDGLDTYADVYVNDAKVLTSDNMFRRWSVDVKTQLKIGNNVLRVYFHSPTKTGEAFYNSLSFRVPVSDNDQATPKVSVFTRKAGYHYGWDWGPRFVTSGIWRAVYLETVNDSRITDLFISLKYLNNNKAGLVAGLEVESTTGGLRQLNIFADDNPVPLYSKWIHLDKGITNLSCSFNLIHPQLWWPNGYGKQKLYSFKAVLKTGDKAIAQKIVWHGIRTVSVLQESGVKGNSFCFLINGVKIFMKGANYIPQDNFLTRVSPQRYEHIINTAVLSNMNMLRVWGGGIYENDLFYNMCDERGILLWQEFMFACAMQPPFETLKQNIYDEAVDNIKRLRNHPSIAMYSGNNEVVAFMGSNYWGTAKGAFSNKKDSMTVINTYKEIFHSILPAAVSSYDHDRFYWSSSPQANNFAMSSSDSRTSGDVHYWGVWGGGKPIVDYLNNIGPFMSEYGFQSFPDMETVKTFALPADYDINSTVMKTHQRSYTGNSAIIKYMETWYKVPVAFPDFLYASQVLQAEAIKIAIEAHRRSKPFCMGSLYWQIDDCWPAASWSSMDYYGHWKALQYEVKRAFAQVLVSPIVKKDTLYIYLVSDSLKAFDAHLQLNLMDFSGRVVSKKNIAVKIAANSSINCYRVATKDLLNGSNNRNIVLNARLLGRNGERLSENNIYFDKPKALNLTKATVKYTLTSLGKVYRLQISAPVLLKNLRVSAGDDTIIFSDNYFDLLPGQSKTISFQSEKTLTKSNISFMSINDIN